MCYNTQMFEKASETPPDDEATKFEEQAKQFKELVAPFIRDSALKEQILQPFITKIIEKKGKEAFGVYLFHILMGSTPPMGLRGRVCRHFDFEGEDSVATFLEKVAKEKNLPHEKKEGTLK